MKSPLPQKTTWFLSALMLLTWGCSPPIDSPQGTASPRVSPTLASPLASESPVAVAGPAFQPPILSQKVFQPLKELEVLQPSMRETETWYANSGIIDNRLGYYTTAESVIEAEARLLEEFTAQGLRPYLEGIGPVISFENVRLCLTRSQDSDASQLFLVAAIDDPVGLVKTLRTLKLPALDPELLRGQKTLVVLATGEGLGRHVDQVLGQSGLVIDPATEATATPTPTQTPKAGPS